MRASWLQVGGISQARGGLEMAVIETLGIRNAFSTREIALRIGPNGIEEHRVRVALRRLERRGVIFSPRSPVAFPRLRKDAMGLLSPVSTYPRLRNDAGHVIYAHARWSGALSAPASEPSSDPKGSTS